MDVYTSCLLLRLSHRGNTLMAKSFPDNSNEFSIQIEFSEIARNKFSSLT